MDYLPSVAAAAVVLLAVWSATGYQHHLYRLPEHRVPQPRTVSVVARRAAVALLAAAAAALVFRPDHYGAGPATLTSAAVVVLAVMASTDLERRLLPNRIMYPAIVAALAVTWAWPDRSAGELLLGGVIGLAAGAVLFIGGELLGALLRVRATAFGLGDVKLMALIGLLVGWPAVVSALFLGIIAAGIPALVMVLVGKGRNVFAYGPYLIAGAVIVLVFPGAFL